MARFAFLVVMGLVLSAGVAVGQWQTVAPGIEYRSFTVSSPQNNLFVTRMDRSNPNCIIDSCIGQGQLRSGRETVSGMAARYNDSINYWGQSWGNRSQVVAAINGDYFNLTTGVPTSGQIITGWQAKRFMFYSGGSGFVWKISRDCFIGGNVSNDASNQKVVFANGTEAGIDEINTTRGTNQLILYTPQYAEHTYTANDGTEVLLEMSRPTVVLPKNSSSFVLATVREVRAGAGSTPIPFDHAVLSGTGTRASLLQSNAAVGDQVKFQMEIKDYGTGGQVPTPAADWTKAYASIGGHGNIVKNGIVPSSDWADNVGATDRHPRTAVAINDNYVYFVVCDGRSAQSAGMSFTELGSFCVNHLAATHAITQDGGGSSALWVNGQIKNVPSDGPERPVANGLMMIAVQPKEQSQQFAAGHSVRTRQAGSLRLGPGTNYPPAAPVPQNAEGTVSANTLNGVRAKGDYWWKCAIGAAEGWIEQSVLERLTRPVPDFDEDNDVDQADFGRFQACVSGPVIAQTDPACAKALLDGDTDVDEEDFAVFQQCFRGPNIAVDPACSN